jgi:hypothetical protein
MVQPVFGGRETLVRKESQSFEVVWVPEGRDVEFPTVETGGCSFWELFLLVAGVLVVVPFHPCVCVCCVYASIRAVSHLAG